jgi:hypothetical protein
MERHSENARGKKSVSTTFSKQTTSLFEGTKRSSFQANLIIVEIKIKPTREVG